MGQRRTGDQSVKVSVGVREERNRNLTLARLSAVVSERRRILLHANLRAVGSRERQNGTKSGGKLSAAGDQPACAQKLRRGESVRVRVRVREHRHSISRKVSNGSQEVTIRCVSVRVSAYVSAGHPSRRQDDRPWQSGNCLSPGSPAAPRSGKRMACTGIVSARARSTRATFGMPCPNCPEIRQASSRPRRKAGVGTTPRQACKSKVHGLALTYSYTYTLARRSAWA